MSDSKQDQLTAELENDLTSKYGVILPSSILVQVLGYKSADAFRQALARKTVPVPVFKIPSRRGHFALTKDVATWLAHCRGQASSTD